MWMPPDKFSNLKNALVFGAVPYASSQVLRCTHSGALVESAGLPYLYNLYIRVVGRLAPLSQSSVLWHCSVLLYLCLQVPSPSSQIRYSDICLEATPGSIPFGIGCHASICLDSLLRIGRICAKARRMCLCVLPSSFSPRLFYEQQSPPETESVASTASFDQGRISQDG